MVDRPGMKLRVRPAREECYRQASEPQIARIRQVRSAWKLLRTTPAEGAVARQPLEWQVDTAPVEHAGFGSGTQFSLAAAMALEQMVRADQSMEMAEIAPLSLAQLTGRGKRSAIGLNGFLQGGFLVDGGRFPGPGIGALAAAARLPDAWRFVLIRPSQGEVGLCGERERAVFDSLPSMSETLADRLCRITLMQILPAIHGGDCIEFRAGLAEFGRRVGEFFAEVQGGIFASPVIRELAQRCPTLASFFVQSSWGPTVAIPCGSAAEAEATVQTLRRTSLASPFTIDIAEPLNCGATVSRE